MNFWYLMKTAPSMIVGSVCSRERKDITVEKRAKMN